MLLWNRTEVQTFLAERFLILLRSDMQLLLQLGDLARLLLAARAGRGGGVAAEIVFLCVEETWK